MQQLMVGGHRGKLWVSIILRLDADTVVSEVGGFEPRGLIVTAERSRAYGSNLFWHYVGTRRENSGKPSSQ